MNRIDALFARVRDQRRPALMPFITAGDPSLDVTRALLTELLAVRGASMLEIGVPYSDPIADGPVISASYTRALRNGLKVSAILDLVRAWRAENAAGPCTDAPIVTMVSYAIVHRHGVDKYLSEAVSAGIDGVIVPDLPVEEAEGAGGFRSALDAAGLRLIQLITPTTPRDRAKRIVDSSSGFIYYVSVTGITGERIALPPDIVSNVQWLKSQTDLPICIGFGISEPEHVQQLSRVADGLIVGSAIVRRVARLAAAGATRDAIVPEVGAFVESLARAIDA